MVIIKKLSPLLFLLLLFLSFQNCGTPEPNNLIVCEGPDCIEDANGTNDLSCSFNGEELLHGRSVIAYLNSSGDNCVSESRVCQNGNLTGSYQFANCTRGTNLKASCLFNGRTIAHNGTVEAFLSSSVHDGETCTKQNRRCDDGTLSGTYQYASCQVQNKQSCLFDGRTIVHGASVRAFLNSASPSSQNLCQASQLRTCNDGKLSGNYTFASCTINAPRSCLFDGKTVPHQGSVTAYRHSSVAFGSGGCGTTHRETRTCHDGALSGNFQYASCEVGAPAVCRFNGQTIPHNGTVTAFQYSSSPYSNTTRCQSSETRRCNNGTLSGTYQFASCSRNPARSCLFDGKTVPHGGKINGYRESTGLRGQTGACAPIAKTCTDGTLSNPGAQYGSCTLTNPKSCLFRGRTIPHGDSVYAYKAANNGGVGKCIGEARICNNGVLSGSANFENCVYNCSYGKFNINSNQLILLRGFAPGCTDSNVNCRTLKPAMFYYSTYNGKTMRSCFFVSASCSFDGNGRVDLTTVGFADNMKPGVSSSCSNLMMSTPLNLKNTETQVGYGYSNGGTTQKNINRNGSLLWKAPYKYGGPLP